MKELIDKLQQFIFDSKITADSFTNFLMDNQMNACNEKIIFDYIETNKIQIVEDDQTISDSQNSSQTPILSKEEEYNLFEQAKSGNEFAKKEIICSFMRYADFIAASERFKNDRLSKDDLCQEGYLGLLKAYEYFDYTRNVPFVCYAYYWINKNIIDAIRKSQFIYIPQEKYAKINRYKEAKQDFIEKKGTEPTKEELAHILRIDVSKIIEIESFIYHVDSLDKLIEDKKFNVSELPNRIKADDPFASEQVEYLLKTLEQRDQEIIKLHFGIGIEEPLKNNEIAKRFGITKQAVGQIIDRSLNKMKEEYDKL